MSTQGVVCHATVCSSWGLDRQRTKTGLRCFPPAPILRPNGVASLSFCANIFRSRGSKLGNIVRCGAWDLWPAKEGVENGEGAVPKYGDIILNVPTDCNENGGESDIIGEGEESADKIAEELEKLEEVVMREDEGKSPGDYGRRADLFYKTSRALISVKSTHEDRADS